jgi:hypothetical protein
MEGRVMSTNGIAREPQKTKNRQTPEFNLTELQVLREVKAAHILLTKAERELAKPYLAPGVHGCAILHRRAAEQRMTRAYEAMRELFAGEEDA